MNLTQSQPIVVLLDRNAHRYAMQFAAEQTNPQKGKQVYLNTLAVCAVNQYLKCLSLPTNLSQSDCWHPGLRSIFDIADINLPNIGKLECRPLLPEAQTLLIPPEAIDDRIGYLAVRLNEELDRVQLLGFIPSNAIAQPPEPIPIEQLRSLDSLIETIHRQNTIINLRQWIDNLFQPEWQPIELLLAEQRRLFRTTNKANAISRGKIITLEGDRLTFILVIKMTDRTEEIDICLQLYPYGENDNLPADLQLTILDERDRACLNAQTKESDNWIQLEFICHPAEKFSIQITHQQTTITEKFIA